MDPEPLPEVLQAVTPGILSSAAMTGAMAGVFGLCLGGVIGTVKKSTPILWSVFTGAQCSVLGATFSASKSYSDIGIARSSKTDVWSLTGRQRVLSTTVAGAGTGAFMAAIFRGPRNVLPGMLVFGSTSCIASFVMNYPLDNQDQISVQQATPSLGYRILHSRLNPMKVLSDDEYEHMLQEKLIRVEADIALVDESINKIKLEESNPTSHV